MGHPEQSCVTVCLSVVAGPLPHNHSVWINACMHSLLVSPRVVHRPGGLVVDSGDKFLFVFPCIVFKSFIFSPPFGM